MIYLDHNATTPLRPEARAAMIEALSHTGNPSSLHAHGRQAREYVERAREQVAAAAGARPQNVIFTSGATESNNIILQGHSGPVLVLATEHSSVREVRPDATLIPVNAEGLADMDWLDAHLARHAHNTLVAIQAANSETGVIQDLEAIGALCARHGVIWHCDAVQALGKIPFDFVATGADFVALSAHKIGGPQGVGALLFKSGRAVPKWLRGGGQERRQRAGTENVAGIAGFGAAALSLVTDPDVRILRDHLETRLGDHVTIHGKGAPRLPNTSCFSVEGKTSEIMLMQYDLANISLSSGSACSSGTLMPSHVLRAMGVADAVCLSALRVSLGWTSTREDIDAFVRVWQKITHG